MTTCMPIRTKAKNDAIAKDYGQDFTSNHSTLAANLYFNDPNLVKTVSFKLAGFIKKMHHHLFMIY